MIHSTTILAIRHRERAVLAGDGQVTFGQTVVKQRARKIRRLYNDRILAGFAGSAADSFALFSRFESKLEQYRGNLERSAVELAKDWRSDRVLRRLEAMLVVLDRAARSCCRATAISSSPTTASWRSVRVDRSRWRPRKALAQNTRPRCADHRREGDGDRRRNLHLHEHEHRRRRAVSRAYLSPKRTQSRPRR